MYVSAAGNNYFITVKKIMKKIFATLMLCVMTIAASAQVKSVDVKGDLRGDFGLGVGITADLVNNFEIAPSFNYYFVDGATVLTVEADFHYDFQVATNWNVYPIVGATYYYSKVKGVDAWSKFGVNLGVGTEYQFTKTLAGFVEGKYQWIDGADDTYFSLGVKVTI